MKITTLAIDQWDAELGRYVTVYEESYEYEGELAHCGGGGGGDTTQTTVQELSPEQRRAVNLDIQQQQNIDRLLTSATRSLLGTDNPALVTEGTIANVAPQFFPGQTFVDFTPDQARAQQLAIDRANALGNTGERIDDLIQFGTQGVLDINNPLLQQTINAATTPVTQNFLENVFPQIGSVAQQQGAFGGSRQGILEAQAARDLNQTVGDIASKIAFESQQRALDTFDRTLAAIPGLQAASFLPAEVLAAVGAERQGLEQAQLAEDIARFQFGENQTLNQLNAFANLQNILRGGTGSLAGQIPGGSTTTSGSGGGGPSTGQSLLGGAATGAAIGSTFGPAGTAVGAGLGALVSLF